MTLPIDAIRALIQAEGPITEYDLAVAQRSGATEARRQLKRLHAMLLLHIVDWRPGRGPDTPWRPAYGWGMGEDAPKPGRSARRRIGSAFRQCPPK